MTNERTGAIGAVLLVAALLVGLGLLTGAGTVQAMNAPPVLRGDGPATVAVTATVQTAVVTTPVSPTLNAASATGNAFANSGRVLLDVRNGYTATITGTVATTYSEAGLALASLNVAVPAGQERVAGPFEKRLFNTAAGFANVTWSATTSVTFVLLEW
jgi:hypothetical protein